MSSASNTPLSCPHGAARRQRSEGKSHCSALRPHRDALEANDWSRSVQARLLVAVGNRSLTQQAAFQPASHRSTCTPGKAQSALPSCKSAAAAAVYGSRYPLLRAPARSTTDSWKSGGPRRGAGSARRVFGRSPTAGLPWARPNPSLNHRTRYGKRRKPGLRHMGHHLSPGLRRLPPQAG